MHRNVTACGDVISKVCGNRLGEKESKPDLCFNIIWRKQINLETQGFHEEERLFYRYNECVTQLKPHITACVHHLQKPCSDRKVVAMKTVRLTMNTAGILLRALPALKIIHLYRDPRGVVNSRRHLPWSQGMYDASNISLLARTYCTRLHRDNVYKSKLLGQYRDRIYTVVFDKFGQNILNSARQLYGFLNLTMPPSVITAFDEENQRMDYMHAVNKWRSDLTITEAENIEKECSYFFTSKQ